MGLAALIAALVLAGLSAWASPWIGLLPGPEASHPADFQILWASGQGFAEGADVHDSDVLDEYGRRAGRPVTPFAAALPPVTWAFSHFGADHAAAHRFWFGVNVGLLAACVALLALALRAAGHALAVALAFALLFLLAQDGTWHSLAMNSTTLLALTCTLGALVAAQRGRNGAEGLLLALAIVTKISPVWLLLVALGARRWRTVFATLGSLGVIGALSLVFAGPALHGSWWTSVLPRLGYGVRDLAGGFSNSLHTWNIAPNGVLSRELMRDGRPDWAAPLAALVGALVLVQTLLVLRRRAPEGSSCPAQRLREYGLGLAGALLASSVTWPHHLVFAAPALAALTLLGRWRLVWVPGFLLLALPLGILGDLLGGPPGLGRDLFAKGLGLFLVFGLCALGVARGARAEGAESDEPSAATDRSPSGADP